MNNKLPIVALGILALVAIIWRVFNPPLPPAPGPVGGPPNWRSESQLGQMDCQAASPDGSVWAGAWNELPDPRKPTRRLAASVRIIPLSDLDAPKLVWRAGEGLLVDVLSWRDAQTAVAVCRAASGQADLTICDIDARTAKTLRTAQVPNALRAIAWPSGSATFLTEAKPLSGRQDSSSSAVSSRPPPQGPRVSLIRADGGVPLGLPIQLPAAPKTDDSLRPFCAMAPDGSRFVIAVANAASSGSLPAYYLCDTRTGKSDRLFTGEQLPGRVDELHLGSKGVLLVCSERDKVHSLVFDLAKRSLVPFTSAAYKLNTDWPTCPSEVRYVTYSGASSYDVASGKSTVVVDLSKLTASQEQWRAEVRDGRYFARTDGDLTTISVKDRKVDIRVISKRGELRRSVLPRR